MPTPPIDYGELDSGQDCNYWEYDPAFAAEVERLYPDQEFDWARDRLAEFGELVGTTIAENADRIDRQGHELHTYDEYGEVQNHLEYHPLQHENDRLAYGNGVVSDAYHAPEGRDEPLGLQHTLAQQSLLCFADAGFVCPISMTTGAAIVLDMYGDDEYTEAYLERLTTTDLDEHIEGAMFLTEKQGGSDVGANEVRAEPTDEERVYELYGEKWFCSNIDAEGTLALARRPDAPEGTDGLSMFIVPHTKRDGELNDQLYRRLKDKLGTISVPTGEVEFQGAEAYLVGEPEEGFTYMTEMMNFERLTQATGSVGGIGRALLESKVHAADREAFGNTIDEYPLMRRDLVDMQVAYEAALAFAFEASRWYDQYQRHEGSGPGPDSATADYDEAFKLFRLLVPIAKYKIARECVDITSYACEVLGGNGYVNGFNTERLLRDAQVGPIWEGTSNILSLDVLRVLNVEDAHEALFPFVRERIEAAEHPRLADVAATVEAGFADLQEALVTLAGQDEDYAQHEAKELAGYIYDVASAALLLKRAQDDIDADGNARKVLVAEWFVKDRFGRTEARGITDGESLADDYYDEVVRHEPIAPDAVLDAPTADD
jgi:acyl-CoA dehydrogenase